MRKFMVCTVLDVLVPLQAADAQQAVQWRVQDGGNGHWYVLDLEPRTWLQSRESALARGGHLVTVTSPAEQEFVAGLDWEPVSSWGVWMGGRRENCAWTWVTGEPWNFVRWAPNEPNGGCAPAYLLLYVQLGSVNQLLWDDCICPPDGVPTGCVVEFDADCNSDGIVDYGQIQQGQLPDTDTNGIPDGCECLSDPALPACCVGNLNGDAVVDGADLGILLGNWGACVPPCAADLNRDGVVDGADLGVLLNAWGTCGG